MPKYNLLINVPEILRIDQKGNLYCVDGRNVKEYLKERFKDLPQDTPLTIIPSSTAKHLNEIAWLVPHLALAC